MSNKTVLINVSFIAELPTDVLESDEVTDLDKLEQHLSEAAEKFDSKFKTQWQCTQTIVLDEETMNCGHCESCGCWVSNRELGESIPQLDIGAIHQNKLLCDECLPKNHKWAF